jgi:hypothetical protein
MTSLRQWLNSFLGLNTHLVNNEFTEPLLRREDELYGYRRWKQTDMHRRTCEYLHQQIQFVANKIIEPEYLYTWNSPASNGFYIKPCEQIQEEELFFLFEWMREKILNLPYYTYTAEKQYREQENQIFQTDFIYFKPSIHIQEPSPWNQQFGNIELHLYYKSREPVALKLMAHVYSDRSYTPHLSFEKLLEELLNPVS